MNRQGSFWEEIVKMKNGLSFGVTEKYYYYYTAVSHSATSL